MNTEEINEHLRVIACHVSEDDIALICKYAQTAKDGDVLVDIGTAYGKSCGAMALTNPSVTVYSLDIEESPLRLKEIPNNLKFIRANSQEYQWQDGEIAMMNIDGGHQYEEVRGDLENWLPHVKTGGYIVLHDYLMPEFGVRKAVDEFVKEGKLEFLETQGISCAVKIL